MPKPHGFFLSIFIALNLIFSNIIIFAADENISTKKTYITSIEQLKEKGMRIGTITGTSAEISIQSNSDYKDAKFFTFENIPDSFTALKNSKLDAVYYDDSILAEAVRTNDDLTILPDVLSVNNSVIGARKGETKLISDINAAISKFEKDGTIADMRNRWLLGNPPNQLPSLKKFENFKETLTIGMSDSLPPFSYIGNGREIIGYDAEFAYRLGEELGYNIKIESMTWPSLIPSLKSNKIDLLISSLSYTEERALSMELSNPYLTVDVKMMVLKDPNENKVSNTSFITDVSQLSAKGIKIGTIIGTAAEKYLMENPSYSEAELSTFGTLIEGFMAIKSGKVNAFCYDEPLMKEAEKTNDNLIILPDVITQNKSVIGARKGETELISQINDAIRKFNEDGTVAQMRERWFSGTLPHELPEIEKAKEPKRTLIVGMSDSQPPFAYLGNNQTSMGYEAEFAYRLGAELGYDIKLENMTWPSLIPSLASNKIDLIISTLSYTEERDLSMELSDPYLIVDVKMMVLKDTAKGDIVSDDSFFSDFKKSFYQNLIYESRWTLVLDGLKTTTLITVFAFILATIIAFPICYLRMHANPILNFIGRAYILLLRGMPIVVFLMIMYYIVFKSLDISPIIVAIIAFGMSSASYIAEILRTAVQTVGKGEIEAARSLGFSRVSAFLLVTLPQAIRISMPMYKTEFVSLYKITSVVGYIAILDLTKAGDIIRSLTYDAFFPLILVAIIYVFITSIIIWLFDYLNIDKIKRLMRKEEKPCLK